MNEGWWFYAWRLIFAGPMYLFFCGTAGICLVMTAYAPGYLAVALLVFAVVMALAALATLRGSVTEMKTGRPVA